MKFANLEGTISQKDATLTYGSVFKEWTPEERKIALFFLIGLDHDATHGDNPTKPEPPIIAKELKPGEEIVVDELGELDHTHRLPEEE